MFSKLKQYKDLRDKAKELQSTLSEEKVEGSAAWGKVKIHLDGNQQVTSVDIDEDFLKETKRDKLETTLKDAFNDGLKKAQRKMVEKMKKMDGLDMPGLK